jgi:hypothetical protein
MTWSTASRSVHAILTAERLKRERQLGLSDFVKGAARGGGEGIGCPNRPPLIEDA